MFLVYLLYLVLQLHSALRPLASALWIMMIYPPIYAVSANLLSLSLSRFLSLSLALSFLKVTGVVMDKDGKAHYVLSGTWDEKMEFSRVMQSSRGGENGTEGKQKTVYQTLKAREVWRRNPLP